VGGRVKNRYAGIGKSGGYKRNCSPEGKFPEKRGVEANLKKIQKETASESAFK